MASMIDFDSINRGFSAKALVYDDYGADHPVILWARAQVRGHLMALVPPPAHILELAAGTGADATFLAEHGYRVHATDLADGMVAETRRKIEALGLQGRDKGERRSCARDLRRQVFKLTKHGFHQRRVKGMRHHKPLRADVSAVEALEDALEGGCSARDHRVVQAIHCGYGDVGIIRDGCCHLRCVSEYSGHCTTRGQGLHQPSPLCHEPEPLFQAQYTSAARCRILAHAVP
jgi:hypothetical protein